MRIVLPLLFLALAVPGCDEGNATGQDEPTRAARDAQGEMPRVTKAIATIHPSEGNEARGSVTFTESDAGVRIEARITGLTPGKHGFHVHQWGDVSCPDGKCAGNHFNPTDEPHGAPDAAERHAGDLGNLEASEAGEATYDRVDDRLTLNGPESIIGRAIVVHSDPDDLKSQPSGNAGGRIGLGVIGIAAVESK